MNKASAGLVAGIDINPNGATETFNVKDPFEPSAGNYEPHRKRKGNSLKVVDPFEIE
jgi:hypothetical protein